jgi:hypothetical protein
MTERHGAARFIWQLKDWHPQAHIGGEVTVLSFRSHVSDAKTSPKPKAQIPFKFQIPKSIQSSKVQSPKFSRHPHLLVRNRTGYQNLSA